MIEGFAQTAVSRWQPVEISQVVVRDRQRELSHSHIEQLRASFARLGGQLQLQPIVLDANLVLVDGAHRLEAARQSGWQYISALVFEGIDDTHRALLEAEANRVRMNLTPVELEAVWRSHYEPMFRARARQRQLAGLRRGTGLPMKQQTEGAVETSLSVASAAKITTGLSLAALDKIAEMRALEASQTAAAEIRDAAAEGLRRLAHPGAKVTIVHRQVMTAIRRHHASAEDVEQLRTRTLESLLERALDDTSALAQRFAGPLGHDLEEAARQSGSNRDLLRAMRVALVHALASVISIECRSEDEPQAALHRIGPEVSRLQSRITAEQLASRASNG